jgi:hypothetical protein
LYVQLGTLKSAMTPFQEAISKIAERARMTTADLVPQIEGWRKDVGEVLEDWKRPSWRDWCPAALVPSLYEEDEPASTQEKDETGEENEEVSGETEKKGEEASGGKSAKSREEILEEREKARAAAAQDTKEALEAARQNAEAQKEGAGKAFADEKIEMGQYLDQVEEIDGKVEKATAELNKMLQATLRKMEDQWQWEDGAAGDEGSETPKEDEEGDVGENVKRAAKTKEAAKEKRGGGKGSREPAGKQEKGKATAGKHEKGKAPAGAAQPATRKRKARMVVESEEESDKSEEAEDEAEVIVAEDDRYVNGDIEVRHSPNILRFVLTVPQCCEIKCARCSQVAGRVCQLLPGKRVCNGCKAAQKKCDWRGQLTPVVGKGSAKRRAGVKTTTASQSARTEPASPTKSVGGSRGKCSECDRWFVC